MSRVPFPGLIDGLLLVLILLSLIMIFGPGGSFAVVAAISVIGLPIALILWGAPFVTLVAVPWRMLYLVLRPLAPGFPTMALSLGLTCGALYVIDAQFPRGPHPDLSVLLAQDGPIAPVAPLPDGRLGLEQATRHRSEPGRCDPLCNTLLSLEQVSELVLNPQGAAPLSMIRRPRDTDCPAGWDEVDHRTCQRPFDGQTEVVLSVMHFDGPGIAPRFGPEHRERIEALLRDPSRPLRSMTRLSLTDARTGSRTTAHMAEAVSAVSGLFGMRSSGIMGERLSYGPGLATRSFSSLPPLPEGQPLPTRVHTRHATPANAPVLLLLQALAAGRP